VTVGEVATAQGPRLRLEAITDTDYRVVHTMTGKTLGEVVQILMATGKQLGRIVQPVYRWTFICPKLDCMEDCCNSSPTPEAAAVALNAHDLNHVLRRIYEAMGGKS